jgi:hypothetical protein
MPSNLREFVFGDVTVRVTHDKKHDEYRGELSWPEVSESGVFSRSIQHHLKKRLRTNAVLVQFTDVTKPASPAKLEAAAIKMVRESGLPRFLSPGLISGGPADGPTLPPGTHRG